MKKSTALSNFSIWYTWEKHKKKSYRNNNFKISTPTWNDEFELPNGSYSVSDTQDYLEYISKKHGENTDNPSIRIHANKIENRITSKIKTGFYLERLKLETIKLLESTENKITKDKNDVGGPYLGITKIV